MSTKEDTRPISNSMVLAMMFCTFAAMFIGMWMGQVAGTMRAVDECRETGQVQFRNSWLVKDTTISCTKTSKEKIADELDKVSVTLREGTASEVRK